VYGIGEDKELDELLGQFLTAAQRSMRAPGQPFWDRLEAASATRSPFPRWVAGAAAIAVAATLAALHLPVAAWVPAALPHGHPVQNGWWWGMALGAAALAGVSLSRTLARHRWVMVGAALLGLVVGTLALRVSLPLRPFGSAPVVGWAGVVSAATTQHSYPATHLITVRQGRQLAVVDRLRDAPESLWPYAMADILGHGQFVVEVEGGGALPLKTIEGRTVAYFAGAPEGFVESLVPHATAVALLIPHGRAVRLRLHHGWVVGAMPAVVVGFRLYARGRLVAHGPG
jgi:hypothetical protein